MSDCVGINEKGVPFPEFKQLFLRECNAIGRISGLLQLNQNVLLARVVDDE